MKAKKIFKYAGMGVAAVLGLLVLVLLGGLAYLSMIDVKLRPTTDKVVDRSPARVARGEYLAKNVALCFDCHGEHDMEHFGFPVVKGTEGGGGMCFDTRQGVPGLACPANITSDPEFGLGKWTDDEILRAIREGVDRHGRPLFIRANFEGLAAMSDADAEAVVAYLRTLPAIHKEIPAPDYWPGFGLIFKQFPKPITQPVVAPPPTDTVAYGKYLVTLADCGSCHDGGKLGPFAGGEPMYGPWGVAYAANITPDPKTGIGRFTREQFIGLFKAIQALGPDVKAVANTGSPMPWLSFSGMTESDLGAIYDYLRTVKPVNNPVVTHPQVQGQAQG